MPIDNRTPFFGLSLPNAANQLVDDVQRLRDAITGIDTQLHGLDLSATTKANNAQSAAAADSTTKANNAQSAAAASFYATAANYTYDAAGKITGLSETVSGSTRSTTISYNTDGAVYRVITVYNGATRTETYTYTAGVITGLTVS